MPKVSHAQGHEFIEVISLITVSDICFKFNICY